MDVFDMLFGLGGQAVVAVFKLGFLPKEGDFLELTEEQYAGLKRQQEVDERYFMLAPENTQVALDEDWNEISIVSETEKAALLRGVDVIEKYCKGKDFSTDTEKLRYAANKMPPCFSDGSSFAKYQNMEVFREE